MMPRAPRQPVDLQVVTKDIKAKIRRVIGELEAIERKRRCLRTLQGPS
jgi:hypothetical protein